MIRLKFSRFLKTLILTTSNIIFIAFLPITTQASSISIRADMFFPISGNPFDERPGYMIDLAQEILSAKGYTVDYQLMPWSRSLIMAEKGLIDCVVGAYKNKDRKLIYPEQPWGRDQNRFYVIKGAQWRFNKLEDIKAIRLGLIHDYLYSPGLDSFIRKPENRSSFEYTYGNNALEQNIAKLLAGRIDATVETNLVMPEKLAELNLENDIIEAGALTPYNNLYIACSPKKQVTRKLIRWFDEGIEELRQSGKLQQILERYHLKDWQELKSHHQ